MIFKATGHRAKNTILCKAPAFVLVNVSANGDVCSVNQRLAPFG